MDIQYDGKTYSLPAGTTVGAFWKRLYGAYSKEAVLADMDGDVLDFRGPLAEGEIRWIPITEKAGYLAAQRTLVMLLLCAVKDVYGEEGDVEIKHSLGDGLYCEFPDNHLPMAEELETIETRMRAIAAAAQPISQLTVSAQKAADILRKRGQTLEAELILQRGLDSLRVYQSGDVTDYFFGPMLPDMGCVPDFCLAPYAPGFLLRFPGMGETKVGPYKEEPLFAKVFLEAEEWGEIIGCHNVAELNRAIMNGSVKTLIAMAEAKQEKRLGELADRITGERPRIRLVCIAGPSSAGKTTFMNRLLIQLRVNGARPVMVSLDDFYKEHAVQRAEGIANYEDLAALDVALFQKLMAQLLEGKEIRLPRFDFQTGTRGWQENPVRLAPGQPIMVEGLHALNPVLSHFVPGYQCLHIYLGALTQLSVSRHNRISTTDTRLIRRLVRDARTRGNDAETTLALWSTVRRGEEENIFHFQGRAEEIFNTALIYELPVLKKKAMPLLSAIPRGSPVYAEARRLMDFLMPFEELDESVVPDNSILREFVGKGRDN